MEEPQSRVGSRSGRESCSPFGRQARALAPLARCEGLEPPGRRQAREGPAACRAPARGSHGHRARSCPGLWLVGPRRTQEALSSRWPGGLRPRTRRLRPNPSFTAPLGAPGLCTSCPVPRTPSPRNSWARHPRPHHLQPAGLSTPWTACRKATRATPWPRCCERWVWSDLVLRPNARSGAKSDADAHMVPLIWGEVDSLSDEGGAPDASFSLFNPRPVIRVLQETHPEVHTRHVEEGLLREDPAQESGDPARSPGELFPPPACRAGRGRCCWVLERRGAPRH